MRKRDVCILAIAKSESRIMEPERQSPETVRLRREFGVLNTVSLILGVMVGRYTLVFRNP